MNLKRQVLLCALSCWLLLSWVVAVSWVTRLRPSLPETLEKTVVWAWLDEGAVQELRKFGTYPHQVLESSLQRLVTLATPGLILSGGLWFVLGGRKRA